MVNWNLREDTLACIQSLLEAGTPPGQVIVVDNGSSDGSVAAIQEQFDSAVHVIANRSNAGFVAGINRGVRKALSSGARWVFILNNDTWVAPSFFAKIDDAILRYRDFSVFAPLIFYDHDPQRIWHLGDRLVPGSLITRSLSKNKNVDRSLPDVVPVDFVSGCGMLVHREVFRRIGLLDSNLIMYGEDVDFCWRARQAGYRLACLTRAKMWHKVSSSANRVRSQARYWRIRNQILFYRKYARGIQLPLMFSFTVARTFAIGVADLAKKQPELVRPLFRGWVDGWRGKTVNRYAA